MHNLLEKTEKFDAIEKRLAYTTPELPKIALTIPEFCERVGISTPTFYKMRAAGQGPREMRFSGSVVRISADAVRDWIAARENPTGADAEARDAQAAKLKARSNYAVSGGAR